MRLVPTLLAAAVVNLAAAASNTLYTSSVSYCSDARLIEVTAFDVIYHKGNSSINYSFSLQATESDLTVDANIYGNAYGIQIINKTVDICSLVNGALCPLPSVNFTGYGTYSIDSSILSDIPGIAWSIPNLEAYARITLTEQSNGTEAACILVTLSNGLSTYQPAVVWVTGIFALVALLIGVAHAALITSPSPAQYRWYDVLYLFQTAAATGFLSVNYPLLYVAFSENFHWAFALFRGGNGVQNQITNLRMHTGGHLSGSVSNSGGIATTLGQDTGTNINQLIDSIEALQNLTQNLGGLGSSLGGIFKRDILSTSNSKTSQTSYLYAYAGVPGYVRNLNIAPANAMTLILYWFLAFVAIAIVFHILLFLIVIPCARALKPWAIRLKRTWWQFSVGNALRICLMWSFPFWIFAFYQFKIGDSHLAIFFGVLVILLTFIPLAIIFVLSVFRSRRHSTAAPGVSSLYTSYRWFHSAGALYRPYRQRFHWFWFLLIIGLITRSALIVFGSGAVASIGSTAVELIIFILMIGARPHKDRKGDLLGVFLSFCRLCAWGLTIAFVPFVNATPIVRAIIGFVIIVFFGISTIMLFIGMIYNLAYGYWWSRHNYRVEDGLEVERFVGSEPGTPPYTHTQGNMGDMRQSQHVDANNFVSGGFADETGMTPQQRNSTIGLREDEQPYGGQDRERYASGVSGYSEGAPEGLASHPEAEEAYANAADGRGARPGSYVSRRTSGRSAESGNTAYYTPQDMNGPTPDRDGRYPQNHYFADGRY